MNPLDALKKFFRPLDVTVALPDDPFVSVNRDVAVEKLKLDQRAREAGERELPPSDATQADAVEAEIHAEISDHMTRAQIDVDNNMRVYSQRLGELGLLRQLAAVTGYSETALGDFDATVIRQKNKLALGRQAISGSYRELAAFEAHHGLDRPAHDQPSAIYTWGTVGLSWILETAANTAFLKENDQYGLVGGAVAATMVAAVNVFLSAIIGHKVWPYIFHRDGFRRALAWTASALWFAGMLFWNVLAAHYRDAKTAGLPNPESVALESAFASPLGLDSLLSFGLLFMGLTFAVISALAAFKSDDPYPRFGETYRRHENRCEEYSDDFEEALDDLKAIRDKAITDLRETLQQLQGQFALRGQIIDARRSLLNRFAQHQDALETFGRSLIDHYRSKNRDARSTPPPAYFDEKWTMARTPVPAVPDEASIEEEVREASANLSQSITRISDGYDQAIRSFQSLEDIRAELEISKKDPLDGQA